MRPSLTCHALLVLSAALCVTDARPAAAQRGSHRLTLGHDTFLLDGAHYQIVSGEMHYARIPRAYWRDRMRKARAMGLNTISTYVFWNLHEPSPKAYDFHGERDIAAYVRIAQKEGLWVILRPGPYVCAEWDLGGYPAWLLADSAMVLRSPQPRFTRPASRWLDRLGRELSPLLATHGGPILAVQVENEYGSFDRDTSYLRWQLDALRHAGFGDALLYTADGDVQLPHGTLPDLPAVVNFGTGEADSAFARLRAFRANQPMMSGEYWAGWFDQWGRKHERTDASAQTRELEWILTRGHSVNLYMFHGGTTFGFMNGANASRDGYFPQTTSYDYDAALDEAGRPTPKFFQFREVIGRHRAGSPLPDPPPLAPVIEIPAFELTEVAPLWQTLGIPTRSERPRGMEALGQSYGYVLYRTTVRDAARGDLVIGEARDYARVYLNGSLVGTLDRRLHQDRLPLSIPSGGARLDILVENSGRVNFTKALRDERKGITHRVTLGGRELTGWEMYPLPMTSLGRLPFEPRTGETTAPAFHRGRFRLDHSGDSFLDMRGWGKGSVWVNGHHLGRFWGIGPQQTLYLPGPWLRRGMNDVIVFDMEVPRRRSLAGLRAPILDDLAGDVAAP
ncbi:MAG: beta-galactosidase [Gemmatimonadota bacterium]|nr:beta-galactosidase [Gemmatimonadota bacterium]